MENSVSHLPLPASGLEPLTCIVIDDEPIALRGMTTLARCHAALKLEAAFSSPIEALEWMKDHTVDLVFLDIEMPDMPGLALAETLPDHTLVVFTTAYSEYAATSYDLDAADYLLKPVSAARFDRAVQKSLHRIAGRKRQSVEVNVPALTLRADRRFIKVDMASIIFIEGMKDYVRIHTDSARIISRMTLKSLLGELPSDRFLRIHKSYVINVSRIESYDNSNVLLRSPAVGPGPVELPIGASFRRDLRDRLPFKC